MLKSLHWSARADSVGRGARGKRPYAMSLSGSQAPMPTLEVYSVAASHAPIPRASKHHLFCRAHYCHNYMAHCTHMSNNTRSGRLCIVLCIAPDVDWSETGISWAVMPSQCVPW